MPDLPSVFLSHGLADAELARSLASELQQSGIDARTLGDIPPGVEVAAAVHKALASASVYIVIVSKDSEHSPYARFELSEILTLCWEDASKRIIPVVVGEAEVPGALRDRHALHIDPEGSARLRRLLEATEPGPAADSLMAVAGSQRMRDRLDEIYAAASRDAAGEGEA
jgi:hypothetical protein